MDSVTDFPVSRNRFNAICIGFLKSRFLMCNDWEMAKWAEGYVRYVIERYEIPTSIVSGIDLRCLSRFWQKLHREMGTKLSFNTTFHLMTDGEIERTIQTLTDVLRACVL